MSTARQVGCPKCGVPPGRRCETLRRTHRKGGPRAAGAAKVGGPHPERLAAANAKLAKLTEEARASKRWIVPHGDRDLWQCGSNDTGAP